MLDRQKGKIIFECDGCLETLETDTGYFEEALTILRREGWWATPVEGGDWEHKCPECNKYENRRGR
jgi:hypothetical protein